jgi:hypothetical protein
MYDSKLHGNKHSPNLDRSEFLRECNIIIIIIIIIIM